METAPSSPSITHLSESALDDIPIGKILPLIIRTDSQATLTGKDDDQHDEAHFVRVWLQNHGLTATQIAKFEAEDMLEWQMLRATNLNSLRLLGLSIGRSLKLINAIHGKETGTLRCFMCI